MIKEDRRRSTANDLCEEYIQNSVFDVLRIKAKIAYTGIRVKDVEESIKFYTKILGMKVTGRTKIRESRGQTVGMVSEEGGPTLELNYYEEGSPFHTEYVVGEGLDHLAFQVDDLDRAAEEARKAGYPLVLDMKSGTSRWVYIRDPNGIFIELFA